MEHTHSAPNQLEGDSAGRWNMQSRVAKKKKRERAEDKEIVNKSNKIY